MQRFPRDSNNGLIFSGLGLGVVVSRASQLSDRMITAGIGALARLAPCLQDPDESLLPAMGDVRHISVKVAVAVANAALDEGLSRLGRTDRFTEEEIRSFQWDPGALDLWRVSRIAGSTDIDSLSMLQFTARSSLSTNMC